jgi:hypothetical protein
LKNTVDNPSPCFTPALYVNVLLNLFPILTRALVPLIYIIKSFQFAPIPISPVYPEMHPWRKSRATCIDKNHHFGKSSICVSAVSLFMEFLHVLVCGLHSMACIILSSPSCACPHSAFACRKEPVSKQILHTF